MDVHSKDRYSRIEGPRVGIMTHYCRSIWFFSLVVVLFMVWGCSGLFENAEKNSDLKGAAEKGSISEAKKGETVGENEPVSVYKKKCGQCHMSYPPDLLPSGSWGKIVEAKQGHFGNRFNFDQNTHELIAKYLKEKAAEKSTESKSKKIVQSLGNKTPLRITEIPYIQRKHRGIKANVFKKKSIGSFSNCKACHIGSENGDFGDINVPD
jgi:hypothetical protein